MSSNLFSSLAAPAFAALLFLYFMYRRSREINAAANDGTARGDSGAHTSTEVSEMAISSGANKDAAAANLGTARGDSCTHISMGVVPEMATSSGANKDAAANHGMANGDSGTHTPTGVSEMATSSGPAKDAVAANLGTARGDSRTHPSMGLVTEMATSSGANKDAAADHGMASDDYDTHTPTGVSEMATSSGPAEDAAVNHGMTSGDSGTHTSMGVVPEMATSSGVNKDEAAINGMASGDSGTHTSTKVPEIDTSSQYDFEVFLSYHGKDTRVTFTNHLYTRLTEVGIRTFKDDKSLRDGEEFGPALLRAIKQSKILIPIFSKNYASSPWCLKELAQMVESKKKNRGQKIIPFFYGVGSEEVRCQSGDYGQAFSSYESEKRYDQEITTNWRNALKAVAKMQGHNMRNRPEGEFIKTFTQKVFNELNMASLGKSDYLVSVDDHVDAIMEMIGAGTSGTQIIGIYGMSGIGKTTIAKIIYDKISHHFEYCCFLRDIQLTSENNGFLWLQKQLISSILKMQCEDIKDVAQGTQVIKDRFLKKRVLLLLDDVEKKDHIDALALKGKHDWLGKGSKIIITTRMVDVLKFSEVEQRYELPIMDVDRSLELFSKHAFRGDSHSNQYIDQSKRAIDIAGGLPLALEVIGSLLFSTEKEMWDATLDMLQSVPNNEILGKLKISYDKLSSQQQRVFLDIACFFSGYNKDILIHFWGESDYSPIIDMMVLQNMCLIKTTEDNEVRMHDQLRDLGRKMVRDESNMEIEKQSRVWDPKEGLDLLRKHKGETKVQALHLKFDHRRKCRFTYENFKRLSNLRFLGSLRGDVEERLRWHESLSNVPPTTGSQEKSDLLPQLRWLSWHNIPPTFNITNLSMEDVVILDLSDSRITHDWKGWSHMKVMENLKVLDLSDCSSLKRLPKELGEDLAGSLEHLSLRECSSLVELPDTIGNLKWLITLDISGTTFEKLPKSIRKLQNLEVVKMWNSGIKKFPVAVWTMKKLQKIEGDCAQSHRADAQIGKCISRNRSMRTLRLSRVRISALPKLPDSLVELRLCDLCMDAFPDFSNLAKLKELDLWFGTPLNSGRLMEDPLPRWLGNLSKLEYLALRFECDTTSSTDLSSLPPLLKTLRFRGSNLCLLPALPSSLSIFTVENCYSLCSVGDLSKLKELSYLAISSTAITEIQGLGCLENLQDLQIYRPGKFEILPDLSNLKKLRHLRVESFEHMVEIQGTLPWSLENLDVRGCHPLQKLPDMSSWLGKPKFEILYGDNPIGWSRRVIHKEPQYLELRCIEHLQILPDLRNFNELESIRIYSCDNLVEIQGELPQSLKELRISYCESLEKLPDLSSLNRRPIIKIDGCGKLNMDTICRSNLNLREDDQQEGEDDEWESGSEEEEDECNGEDDEFKYEGEDEE